MMLRLHRLWIQVTSNRRQFGILCTAIAVGLLLWARLIVVSDMPRTAIAESVPELSDDADDAHESTNSTSEKSSLPARDVAVDAQPTRDPFRVSSEHFPKPTPLENLTAEGDKSDAEAAEDSEQSETRLVSRLQGFVNQFELEAAMPNASIAVISGTMYRAGESVPVTDAEGIRFRVADIRHRAVTLEWEGRSFELKMESPGG
ncbi:MAG: hypothetical protein AAF432_02605 [Planctomycetota bacterium]